MENENPLTQELKDYRRRKLLNRAIMGMGVFGVGSFVFMLTRAVNTPQEMIAARDLKVDLNTIPLGTTQTLVFKGSPLSIRHRTPEEMQKAEAMYGPSLHDPYANNLLLHEQDPATNANRSIAGAPSYIAVIGTCTRKDKCALQPESGDFNGWLCPCCSSHYDLAGRMIKGVAPRNLLVPRYRLADNNILHVLG